MKYLLLLVIVSFFTSNLFSQGCSDAGFCSINGINPTSQLDSTLPLIHQVLIGHTAGVAQFGVLINSPYVQYDVQLFKSMSLSTKLNYAFINGSLTSNQGLSDVFISTQWKISKTVSIIHGVKIPMNEADKKYKESDLPMSYQTTLGTYDYLAGISFGSKNILVSIGTQVPVIQNNNSFLVENFLAEGINPNYLSTRHYVRQADLIIRFNYRLAFRNEKLKLTLGAMPIYHINDDKYIDQFEVERSINRSKGLTMNINSVLRYQLSKVHFFDITVGLPVASRKSRPDGLSQFAVNIQYGIKF